MCAQSANACTQRSCVQPLGIANNTTSLSVVAIVLLCWHCGRCCFCVFPLVAFLGFGAALWIDVVGLSFWIVLFAGAFAHNKSNTTPWLRFGLPQGHQGFDESAGVHGAS